MSKLIIKEKPLTDEEKAQLNTGLTETIIRNISSNFQSDPRLVVLTDDKYKLQYVEQVTINRSKSNTCNTANIALKNLYCRYSGPNESKLASDIKTDIFIGFEGHHLQKFSGHIDKDNLSTNPNGSNVTITCRDKAKHYLEREISTPIYDENYLGVSDWHCNVDEQDNKVGFLWSKSEITKDICYMMGMVEGDVEIIEVREVCQAEKQIACSTCKAICAYEKGCLISDYQDAVSNGNQDPPECIYKSTCKYDFCFPGTCPEYEFICSKLNTSQCERGISRPCKHEIVTSFIQEYPLDIWSKLAQSILWETFFDFSGKFIFRQPKKITGPVEFFFKEERDLKQIRRERTDDFLINDVTIIGQTQDEHCVTYPFAPVAQKDSLRLDRGESLHNYSLQYPDCVALDNIKTLVDHQTSTTLIEPRDFIYQNLEDNPENSPKFDIRVHLPSYAQPYEKDIVLDASSVTGTTKRGRRRRTWLFRDTRQNEGSKIYLSNPVWIKENSSTGVYQTEHWKGYIQHDLTPQLEIVDLPGETTAPDLVYHKLYNSTTNSVDLYAQQTRDGEHWELLKGVTKKIIREECVIRYWQDGSIYSQGDWKETATNIVTTDVLKEEFNPEKEIADTYLTGIPTTEYNSSGDRLTVKNYYHIKTEYLVNGHSATEEEMQIIEDWQTRVAKPENFYVFYYTNTKYIPNTGEAYRWYKYDHITKVKTEITEIEFEKGAAEPEATVVQCEAGGSLGGCSFVDINEEGVTVEGINDADDMEDEFIMAAIALCIALNIAGNSTARGPHTVPIMTGSAAYAHAAIIITLFAWIGRQITEGDYVEYGVRVWARRREEILERRNLTNNNDGWLNNPKIELEGDVKTVVFEKNLGAELPIRQIGWKCPETEDNIVCRFKIVGYNYNPITAEITLEEILVDKTGYDVKFNKLGFWWDFFQRRDDFKLRNYRYIKIVFSYLYNVTKRENLLTQVVTSIESGNRREVYKTFFDSMSQLKALCFFVPDFLDENSREIFHLENLHVGQNTAYMNIENKFKSNQVEMDIRVWGKAFGKYCPSIIVSRKQSEHSKNQYQDRTVEIFNPLINDQDLADEIARKIISSSSGNLYVYEWESLGKVHLREGQIVTIKEKTTGLKSGIREVWRNTYQDLQRPFKAKIGLENQLTALIIDMDNTETQLVEVDQNSQLVWRCQGLDSPTDAVRLAYQGNTLIADYGHKRVIEVAYFDPANIVWEYDCGSYLPVSIDRVGDYTAIGMVKEDMANQALVRVIKTIDKSIVMEFSLAEPHDLQLIIGKKWDENEREDVLDYEKAKVLIADPILQNVFLVDMQGRVSWQYVDTYKPVSVQYLTSSETVLICDAGEVQGANKVVPRIFEVDLRKNTQWILDYRLNPDPWYTTENICQTFRPIYAQKDLVGNILVVDENNHQVYKFNPASKFYISEVEDEYTISKDKDEYYTRFKAVPIEQSAFLLVTNFGKNFATDEIQKQVESKNTLGTAVVQQVLPGDKYIVELLSEKGSFQVSNATTETFRKNDTVLIGFEYGNKQARSIVGRRMVNGYRLERGKPTVTKTNDTDSLTGGNTTSTTSVDLSDIYRRLQSLEDKIKLLEGGR